MHPLLLGNLYAEGDFENLSDKITLHSESGEMSITNNEIISVPQNSLSLPAQATNGNLKL